jgi:hypothetical protein
MTASGRFPTPALGDADTVPRFEFRIWGDDLSAVADTIVDLGDPPRVGETIEIYLPVKQALHLNPKIRRSLLDVKVLIDRVDDFERWEPQLKCVMPIGLTQLVDEFFPLIDTEPPAMPRPSYSADLLVAEVVDPHPALDAVVVMKTRHLYRVGSCTAEVSEVGLGPVTRQTVAIESTHLQELHDLRDRLDIANRKNRSYPRMIHSLKGWIED